MGDDPTMPVGSGNRTKLLGTLGLGFALGVGLFGLGEFFLGSSETPVELDSGTTVAADSFTCSMHPQIRQPEMGPCPLCGMDLIASEIMDYSTEGSSNRVNLSERARALAKLRTTLVHRKGSAASELRLLGRIQPDESTLKTVTAWTSGRIDRLHVRVTGETVRTRQVIATLYSPEVFAAHQDLIVAKRAKSRLGDGSSSSQTAASAALDAARQRLRLLGVPEVELQRLEQTKEPIRSVSIRSPYAGTVIKRVATEGAYIKTGSPLYTIAKLDALWVQLDAYESDLARISLGQSVEISVEALPGEVFRGRITFIDPTLDVARRTARVRVVVENQDGRLRPGMFAKGTVMASTESRAEQAPLVIPVTAPLMTGRRAIVYVETRQGADFEYEARVVRLGPRLSDVYPVVAGLSEGERVVTRGAFVLDADLQIRGGGSMMTAPDDLSKGPWDSVIELSNRERKRLGPVVSGYLKVQDALAEDSLDNAKSESKRLTALVRKLNLSGKPEVHKAWKQLKADLVAHSFQVSQAADIENARLGFELLSAGTLKLLNQFGNPLETVLHLAHCPMAAGSDGASWVQRGEEIRNSYFGSSMYRCGELVEKVDSGGYLAVPAQGVGR